MKLERRKWEHLVSVVERLQVLVDVKSIGMSLNFISSEMEHCWRNENRVKRVRTRTNPATRAATTNDSDDVYMTFWIIFLMLKMMLKTQRDANPTSTWRITNNALSATSKRMLWSEEGMKEIECNLKTESFEIYLWRKTTRHSWGGINGSNEDEYFLFTAK